MIPSVKTLKRITDNPRILRAILEADSLEELEALAQGKPELERAWRNRIACCYHAPAVSTAKMHLADAVLETHGVEHVAPGRARRAPGLDYCNTGDPYRNTLLFIDGRGFRVGAWGDLVERGGYA